jgi:hypothetical protein
MLGYILRKSKKSYPDLLTSKLFNEKTFYPAFLKDLNKCGSEVLIESPFITNRRLNMLLPTLEKLKTRKVRVVINTRNPEEHDDGFMREDGRRAIASLQRKGIHVLYTSGHHRKLAINLNPVRQLSPLAVRQDCLCCSYFQLSHSSELVCQ